MFFLYIDGTIVWLNGRTLIVNISHCILSVLSTEMQVCVCVFDRQYRRDMRANCRAVGKLRVAAEMCKRVLSTLGAAQCSVDSLYEGVDFNSTLSRLDGQSVICH